MTARAVGRARAVRRNVPVGERRLWVALRRLNLNIRRQVQMGRYTADFIHHRSRMVIEVDSARRDFVEAQLHDAEWDAWFASQGYRTLRVDSRVAAASPDFVAERIAQEIAKSDSSPESSHPAVGAALPSPTLPSLRGRGEI